MLLRWVTVDTLKVLKEKAKEIKTCYFTSMERGNMFVTMRDVESFGQVENSRRHLCLFGMQEDQSEEQKLRLLQKHLNRCADARKIDDWKRALRESEAAIAVGTDFSPWMHNLVTT